LQNLEINGFIRGENKGKTMDVPLPVIFGSLQKQWKDLEESYLRSALKTHLRRKDGEDLKRRIADLRNVAGCLFLKLEE
jgi:hypothetical protein